MSLCFFEAFKAKHEGLISDEEYIGHLTAHLRGTRHPSDDLNDQQAEEKLRRWDRFTTLFRVFALENSSLSTKDTAIYDHLLRQCSVGDFEATKASFAELKSNQSLSVPLQALAALAARKGHTDILGFLLQNGAKLDEDVEVAAGQVVDTAEMIELLWNHNWRNIQHSKKVQDGMVSRSMHRPVGMLKFLLRQGAEVPDGLFKLPSVGQVSLPVMKALVEKCGTGPLKGTAALMLAVRENNRDVVEYFCQIGLPLNDVPPELDPREPGMCSPLYTAVQKNDIGMLELLLEHGADPHAPYASHHQQSVLQAVRERHSTELLAVLEKYASPKPSTEKI